MSEMPCETLPVCGGYLFVWMHASLCVQVSLYSMYRSVLICGYFRLIYNKYFVFAFFLCTTPVYYSMGEVQGTLWDTSSCVHRNGFTGKIFPVHFYDMPDIPLVGVAQGCVFAVCCKPCPGADGLKGNICQAQLQTSVLDFWEVSTLLIRIGLMRNEKYHLMQQISPGVWLLWGAWFDCMCCIGAVKKLIFLYCNSCPNHAIQTCIVCWDKWPRLKAANLHSKGAPCMCCCWFSKCWLLTEIAVEQL